MEELEDRSYAIPEPLQDEKEYDIVADMVATAQEPRAEISNVEFSKFQNSSDNAFSNLLGTNEPKKKGFQNEGFALGDAYDRLSDGTLSGKYENFLQGSDNEERLAKEQSSGEQWRNGIAKFWGKTITAVGGGTVGTLYGIGDALMKGDFTSIYDNDFYDVMDDLNKRMDNGLSNYYTKEQKEMGFLESVGTVNFWANDFLGGLSFTAGAIASEAIWAAATGGTSLVAAAGRYGLKASKALSGIKKAKSLTNAFTGYMSKANALRSATKYGRYASLANASRIAYTSAGYEAGVESRMFKQEQEEAFDNYFKGLGREATTQEIASFNDELSGKTNAVFATNMALVGSSNLITFGKIFNVGNPLKSTSSSVKKALFGEGVELVEGVMKPVKRNIAQRIAGVSYHALKNPVVEGVFEEGGQSVTTKTAGSMIESMYNVDKDVLSFTEAFHEGMVETYGTKEGRKEVFLGMLIGAVGGGGSSLLAKQNPFAEIKDAAGKVSKKDIERIEQYEKGVNTKEAVGLLTGAYGNEVSQKVVAEIARANGLSASTKQMDEAVKNGDLNGYEQGRLSGILANVIYAENTGLSDLVEEQIATEIENTTEADYENSKADGFDLKEAKEKAKRDYKKIKDDFSRAKEASSYLIGSLSKKEEKLLGKNTETLRTMLAYNSVMTERTLDYADELNTSLIEVVGEYAGQDFKGLGTASKIKVTLDKAKKEQSRLFYNTNRRLKTATKSYDKVTKEIESQAEQLTSTPESQKTKTEKLLKLQNKQKELLEQKEALRKERDLVLKTIRIQTNSNKNRQDTSVDLTISEDIDNIEERLNDINSIVEDIAKTDYEKYIRLKSTITAYQKAIKSAKQMSEIMEDLSNTETGLKGATRTFLNTAREYNEPTKRLIKNLEDIFEERKNEAEQRDNLRDVVEKINTQKISSFDPVATPDTTVKDIQSQIDEINEKYDKQIEEIENEPDVSTLSIKDIERQRKNRLENMNIGDTIESINQEFDTILKINGLYDKKNDIQKRRRQELNEVKKAIKERQKREINAKYDAELAELKAETTTTTSNQSTEANIEKRRQEELNIPDLVVNSESKQALIDIINLTDSKDIADFVNKGTWNNEGDLGFDENGNVVLTRFADSKEGLTKSGNITSPSELKSLMNNYGGEQIPTSGVVGGIEAYASENGVIGTYRIPLSEFKELLKQGYIQFAGFGNKEFVLSPHIASKYLSEINGKLLTESKINAKYDAELAELKAEEQTKAETTTPTSNQSDIEAKKTDIERRRQEEISSKSKTRKGNTISIFEVSKRQNDAVFNDKEWKKLNDYTTKLPKGVVMEGTPMYDELVALGVKPSSNGINGTDVVKKLEEIANKVKAKTKANIKSEGLKVITNDARALADKKFFDGINAKYDAELAELKAETKTTTPNQSEIENLEKQKQQELNDIKIDNSDEALKKINDIYEKELADTRSQKIDKNTQKERVNKKRRQELQEINSNKQQVSEAIDEIFSKYKGLVENVDNPEDSRPTEEDFSRYMELISKTKVNSDTLIGKNYQNASTRVIKKTGLTKSELLEFQKVSRKLADWQIISGMTNGDVSLKDLLDQKLSSQKEVVKTTTTPIDAKQEEEMIQGVINERVTSDTHVKNINTSDSVLVQKRKGEYNISHFEIEKYDESIEIIKSKKATSNNNGILTFKKGDQEFTVGTTLSGRYVIDNEEDFNKFLELLDMKVMSFKGQKNTWSAIYSKEDNGQYGLQESHFEVNQIDSADINIIEPQKLYDMEPGEKLFFKVSLRDSYNTVLINDPKISRKKLVKNVNIYVVNEKGDVLGQIKSSNSNTTHTEKTKEIREQAANFVWEQINPDVAPVQVTGTENIAGFSVQKATATKMQEITLPFYTEITRVYTNSPNVKLNSQGEVIQQDIPQGSIESYGVLKNGEIILNENSKAKVADISRTYLKTLDNTPIIIVKQGKKLIAYPARIKPKQINLGESLMEVLKDENNDSDKIIAISDFLANNGIDPKKYNLKHVSAENSSLYDGTVETIMDDIKGMASYITEEEYLSKTFTPSRLENEVTTSLNLKNKPFRNPKLEMESEKIEINEDISDKYYERHFNRNKNIPQSYLEQIAQKLDIDLKPLGKLTKFNKKILSLYAEDIQDMVKERFKMTPQNQATSKSNQQVKCKS